MPTFADYIRHGWSICALEKGRKGPRYAQWNINPIQLDAADGISGAGLLLALSGVVSLDIDDMALAHPWLAERNIDVDALLADDYAVGITSGRVNRAKLLFKASKSMPTVQPAGSGLELRSASANGTSLQDVLPPSIHPTTGKPYEWRLGLLADWRAPPAIPAALLSAWRAELPEIGAHAPPPTDAPDVALLRALIEPFDPNASYPDWIKSGMKLHHASGGSPTGLAVWLEWSQRSKKCKGLDDLRTHWASFVSAPGKHIAVFNEAPAKADEFPVAEPEAELLPEKPKSKRNPRIASALGLQTTGAGKMVCNVFNAEQMIRNMAGDSIELVYDEFLARKLVRWPDDAKLHVWTDYDAITLQVLLQRKGLQTLSQEGARSAAERVAHEHSVNCVADWLKALVWDNEKRLTMFLPRAFGTPATRYYLRSGRNWLIGMVRRAFNPGCQVDTATILEGPQGSLKSTALRILAQPWFAELVADPDTKDFEQQLRGIWLGEFPELQSLQRGSIERLKQFITNREDRYRPSFGREEVAYPRRCVLVGTTNRADWARDETGNRRFIPVECARIDLPWIAANRDQLFAEAVRECAPGRDRKHWHWPKDETRRKQADRAPTEEWTEIVSLNWRDAVRREGEREYVTIPGILKDAIGVQAAAYTGITSQRVARALRELGFERGQQRFIDKVLTRPWYAPKSVDSDDILR